MENISIIDKKTGKLLNMRIVFSFCCKETKKNYVVLDNLKPLFEKNSTYNHLDILEIIKEDSKTIYVSEIQDDEWDAVKNALLHDIFSNVK